MFCSAKDLKALLAAIPMTGEFKPHRANQLGVIVAGSQVFCTNSYSLACLCPEGEPIDGAYFLSREQIKSLPNDHTVIFENNRVVVDGLNKAFGSRWTIEPNTDTAFANPGYVSSLQKLLREDTYAYGVMNINLERGFRYNPVLLEKALHLFSTLKINCKIIPRGQSTLYIEPKEWVKNPYISVLVQGQAK